MLSFGWPLQHHFVKRWPRFTRRPNLTASIWSSWQLLPISNQLSLQNCKISFLLEYKSIIYPYISLGLRHCVVVRPFSSQEQIRPSMGMLQAFSFNNGFFFIKLLITYQILWNIKLLYEQFLVNMCSYWEIWNVIYVNIIFFMINFAAKTPKENLSVKVLGRSALFIQPFWRWAWWVPTIFE